MAVVGNAEELADNRVAIEHDTGAREYRRFWLVQTNAATDEENVVATAIGLPQRGFIYQTDTAVDIDAVVTDMTFRQRDLPKVWEVEAHYQTEIFDLSGSKNQTDPTFELPEITFGFESSPRAVYGLYDLEVLDYEQAKGEVVKVLSSGIVNSAGEPYDPPAEIESSRPVLTVARNELFFNPNLAIEYQDAVNLDVFAGFGRHMAKVKGISAVMKVGQHNKQRFTFWRVRYEIVFRKETWDLILPDVGTYYIDASDSNKKKTFEVEGHPRLGNLTAIARDGATNGDDAGTTIGFNRFEDVYREKEFSLLNLPVITTINLWGAG